MIYQAQEAVWTPEAVARFWDHATASPVERAAYFTRRMGPAIFRFLQMAGLPMDGEFLDYGCGPGDLSEELLARGCTVSGLDFSTSNVNEANLRFANSSQWGKCLHTAALPSLYDDAAFDIIVCIETIEHLLDEWLEPTFSEFRRLLKPGGLLFLTTPCDEDLDQSCICCPFCQISFHRWQHVRKWTAATLSTYLEERDWSVEYAHGIDLTNFLSPPTLPPWREWSPRTLGDWLHWQQLRLKERLDPRSGRESRLFHQAAQPGPHLVAIARRANQ